MAKYFTAREMACSHCGESHMDEEFMEKLDELRERFGKPLAVSSAYRCPEHPVEARKSTKGAHVYGKAADFAVSHWDAHKVLQHAMELGFTGIGIQQKGDGRFIHVDTCTSDEKAPRPTVWSY